MAAVRDDASIRNYAELRAQSLATIAPATSLAGYVCLIIVIAATNVPLPVEAWIGSTVLVLGSSAAYALSRRLPRVGGALIVISTMIAVGCAMVVFASDHVGYLFLMPILFAGVLLGQVPLFLTALAAVVLFALIGSIRLGLAPLSGDLLFPAAVIALVATGGWLSERSLNTALGWVWSGYELALRNASLASERRAELRRTFDALNEATARLERANHELIRARKEAEEARSLRDRFVANVSHELRTPLNLVVGFAEIMYLAPESYEGVVWTPDLQGDIGAMYRAGRQLQSLVDDVLDLSRIDAARLPMFREQSDIRNVVLDALETTAPLFEQRGLSYGAELPESLPDLLIDRTRIRQVLLNLLNNAARFVDSGGVVVRVEQADDAVLVSVRDTGIGIPEQQLGRIFEEFRQVDEGTRRRGGAGLGLALARQFVQLHGGRMWAESKLGIGSTFHFTLPLPGTMPQSIPLTRTTDQRQAPPPSGPILFVEPDPTLGQMLARYLGDRRVVSVPSPSEAEGLIETEHPEAVIVNQPPTETPETWMGTIGPASERHGVPVMRCSIPSPSWLATSVGLDGCLTKPVLRQTLTALLRERFGKLSTVLVVDDNPGFVSLMVRMLEATGLVQTVLTAYDGAEALRLARERLPMLVLLDLLMPDIDGFAVLKELRSDPNLRHTAIIAVTATSYAEEVMHQRVGWYTVSQAGGFSPGQLADLLQGTMQCVRARYGSAESTPARVSSSSLRPTGL